MDALAAITALVLLLGWALSRRRPLVLALAASLGIVWLGQQGDLAYLGVVSPSRDSYLGPMTSLLVAALINVLLSGGGGAVKTNAPTARWLDRPSAAYLAACIGSALIVYRFARFGVPVLNSSRFSIAAAISPLESILTAVCLTVSTAMISAFPGKLRGFARLVLIAQFTLVALNASRLLLMAMLVALIAGRLATRAWTMGVKSWLGLALGGALIATVILPAIYTTRAGDDAGSSELAERAERHAGRAGPVVAVLGSGAYISARNGAAVATRLLQTGEAPPEGYVVRAALYVASIAPFTAQVQDPERFLTRSVFGLDEAEIGSVALPLASAFQVDFGLVGAAALGLIYVLGFDMTNRRGPVTSAWWSFGVALSSYGLYLISVQFIGILVGFIIARPGMVERRQEEVPQ